MDSFIEAAVILGGFAFIYIVACIIGGGKKGANNIAPESEKPLRRVATAIRRMRQKLLTHLNTLKRGWWKRAALWAAVAAVLWVLLTATAHLVIDMDKLPIIRGTFIDERDGKTYGTVKIGHQTWMAENLNYYTSSGSWCYNNDTSYCGKYGRLYDWETAMEACPSGWHLPDNYEWDDLTEKVGSIYLYPGHVLKAKHGWYINDDGYIGRNNGTDNFGFSALPGGGFSTKYAKIGLNSFGGSRSPLDELEIYPTFQGAPCRGNWWTATDYYSWRYSHYYRSICSRAYIRAYYRNESGKTNYAYYRSIIGNDVNGNNINKEYCFSVRCVQDYISPSEVARLLEEQKEEERKQEVRRQKEEEQRQKDAEERIAMNTGYFTDPRDGQTYRTMLIGGKTWMAQNLNYRADSSWCYDNKKINCDNYGRLYVWNTATTACPSGWHLSTQEEWGHLIRTVGGTDKYGPSDRAAKLLKANCCWNNRFGYYGRNGTDEYGFSALPGGYRYINGGVLYRSRYERDFGPQGSWWTATEDTYGGAFRRYIRYDRDYVGEDNHIKEYGFSARCVADNP
jgi:uncharacterized protein (TIGR02145 family)